MTANEKDLLKLALLNRYISKAYTHNYIFGFIRKHMVYAVFCHDCRAILDSVTYLGRASTAKGGTHQVRFRPNKVQQEILIAHSDKVRIICSEDDFMERVNNSKHNRGEVFEEMVAEIFEGERNAKVNANFTEAPDVTIDGVPYQVKLGLNATFTDERTLDNLGA